MSTLIIRMPESKHSRLQARGVSVNRLIDELATVALTEFDTETRFRALAARGSKKTGIAPLDKLDKAFARK